MTEIIIAGDMSPRDRVARLFDESRYADVLEESKSVIGHSDYAIVNLECPIVEGAGEPIKKTGPHLRCNNSVAEALKYAGFNCVTLANNHLCDYGEAAVLNTLKELDTHTIDHVGAGSNLSEAQQTLYTKIGDETFAFINCCEHEFCIATDNSAGCNPLDAISQYNAIQEARLKAGKVIVIVHGGVEYYQLPTPRMVRTYRFFIDAGADAVINHHQHCFSGYEFYKEKPIVYGLGNFCFDRETKKESVWFEGYIAKLQFDKNKISLTPIPYLQCNATPAVQFKAADQTAFHKRLKELCDIISDNHKLTDEYNKLLEKTWKSYDMINPYSNRYLSWLYRKGLLPSLMPQTRFHRILNAIRCESHLERLLHALSKRAK
jgi:poly-gamma-glutamate synthesis protein (capsule biosynthesis protein)